MKYHWERLSTNQLVLFEEGTTWEGRIPPHGVAAAINKLGPNFGSPKAIYRAAGKLMDDTLDFDSLAEAQEAVEAIVSDRGGTIEAV